MSKQYHYLTAGLPDILFDDSKAPISLNEFREALSESVDGKDLDLLKLYFYRYDNKNIFARLQNPEAPINELGNLEASEVDELIALAKAGAINDNDTSVPGYLMVFFEAYYAETPLSENKSWELQLSELYYDYVTSVDNEFIAGYFRFEQNSLNVATAIMCRKHEYDVGNEITGSSEITEKLAKSTTRDFGLSNEVPMLDHILKIYDEDNLVEREKKFDMLTWAYLDEEVFFHYFTIERIFSFVVKLAIVERWIHLDKETGLELFNKLIKSLEGSYELPAEL